MEANDGGESQSQFTSPDYRAYTDAEDNLKFHPPLYIQRYETVKAILRDERWSNNIETIVEFGCAELAMFSRFKDMPNVTRIVMVDVDPTVLEYYSCRAAPLNCDFLNPRKKPLHVDVLCGSVADCDVRAAGADAVVCIELIEHLYEDVLQALEFTIFGFIRPKIAVFTTPNSDFNILLKGLGDKFRHPDHKFEWSRKEFKTWADRIVTRFPNYKVEIKGVGHPPQGKEEMGCCSQLALFIKVDDAAEAGIEVGEEVYTVCRTYDHPVFSDNRTDEEKLINEIQYYLHMWSSWEIFYCEDEDVAYIPLNDVVDAVRKRIPTMDIDMHLVRKIIEGEYIDCEVVEREGTVMAKYDRSAPSYQFEDEDYEPYCCPEEDESQVITVDKKEKDEEEEEEEEEMWDDVGSSPIFVEPMELEQIQRDIEDLSWARLENEVNLIRERELMLEDSDESYDSDSDTDEYYWTPGLVDDCEKRWNHTAIRPPFTSHNSFRDRSLIPDVGNTSHSNVGNSSGSDPVNDSSFTVGNTSSDPVVVCGGTSSLSPENLKQDPITDSGVELSPEKSELPLSSEFEVTCLSIVGSNSNLPTLSMSKDIPKSTSVEVLHLDGLPCLKRSAGLECVEFSSSSSVTLCYTGEMYHHSKKDSGSIGQTSSPELKSLDGSLIHDVSLDIDQAGDSGYPNSSSLLQDVDLTPEQVDDISSENGDHSNQSISEDESEVSDGVPAARRILFPRRPVVPIIFENVENGDLANNNRDGEGNNAVPVPGGDEREFVARVEEGEMLPLMAAPIQEDIILPDDADPYPFWLSNLLSINEKVGGDERLTPFPSNDEKHLKKCSSPKISDSDDEGLGDDTVMNSSASVPKEKCKT